MTKNSKGFAHQGLILLVVLVAAIAAVGYRVYLNNSSKGSVTKATAVTSSVSKKTTQADIQQASSNLDSDQGDSQLDPSQLDNDLNQLL